MSHTYHEHTTRLFRRLRELNPAENPVDERAYYEIRATLDVINYVANEQSSDEKIRITFTAGKMGARSWTGYFKVDKHPEYLFEVIYTRKDESSSLTPYKLVPQKPFRLTRARRHQTRFNEEIRTGY